MTLADVIAAALFVGVIAYAVLGGADFGSGFWDLTAGTARRGARARALIDLSIGPVWEANHVWLIFCLVVLWTAFPTVFATMMTTLFIPFLLAAIGIVLRGAGFAFRKATHTFEARRAYGVAFAASSIVTPFFMGTIAGAVASGRVPPQAGTANPLTAWLGPASILGGVLAVATCAFLAAVFLTFDAARNHDDELERHFAIRAVAAGFACGAIALVGIGVLHADAPYVFGDLTTDAVPLVIISGLCGVGAMLTVNRRASRTARILAVGAVGSVVAAWGVAQYPYLLPETVTIDAAASPRATLLTVLVVAVLAVLLIGPALALLFWLDQENRLEEESLDELAAANVARARVRHAARARPSATPRAPGAPTRRP